MLQVLRRVATDRPRPEVLMATAFIVQLSVHTHARARAHTHTRQKLKRATETDVNIISGKQTTPETVSSSSRRCTQTFVICSSRRLMKLPPARLASCCPSSRQTSGSQIRAKNPEFTETQ